MKRLVVVVFAACASPRPAPAPSEPANEAEAVPDRERLGWNEGVRPFLTDLLAELRATGEREGFAKLLEMVVEVEALIRQAEGGELNLRVMLARYDQLVVEMTDPIEEWVVIQLDDLRGLLRKAEAAPFASD